MTQRLRTVKYNYVRRRYAGVDLKSLLEKYGNGLSIQERRILKLYINHGLKDNQIARLKKMSNTRTQMIKNDALNELVQMSKYRSFKSDY